MKNILKVVLWGGLISMLSCGKFLDIEPTQSISEDVALRDVKGVERALTGCYSALHSAGSYGRNLVIVGELAADNLTWTGTTLDYGQIGNHQIAADNGVVEGMWSAAYDGINRANNILDALDKVEADQALKNRIKGEALFLRSLMYYNLAVYFGNVPLRLQPVKNLESLEMEASSRNSIMQLIEDDLRAAAELLPDSPALGRASKWSAKSLLARVLLWEFHLSGSVAKAEEAIALATVVIESSGIDLAPDYESLFNGSANEELFAVVFDAQNNNRLAQYFFSRKLTGRYEVAPSQTLIQAYTATDDRKISTIAFDVENKAYGYKFRDISAGTDKVWVIRLAEMYLIRAEARSFLERDAQLIVNDINRLRLRAKAEPLAFTNNYEYLRIMVESERRLEVALEGHRWPDLLRTGRAVEVLGIAPEQTLFPIPLSELQTNKKIKQNPGY